MSERSDSGPEAGALVWALVCAVVAVVAIALANLLAGCSMVVGMPGAHVALYQHIQVATNMVVNQDNKIDPRLANDVYGVVGAQVKDNSILSGNKGVSK